MWRSHCPRPHAVTRRMRWSGHSMPLRRWMSAAAACAATCAFLSSKPEPHQRSEALASKVVSARIDGELVTALEGQSILEVARAHDKFIPTLCYLKGLSAVGACRVCM